MNVSIRPEHKEMRIKADGNNRDKRELWGDFIFEPVSEKLEFWLPIPGRIDRRSTLSITGPALRNNNLQKR
jgi:hypothetical protein